MGKLELIYRAGSASPEEGDFTLVVTFSKVWCFKRFWENFRKLRIPMDICHLLIYDNSDIKRLGKLLVDVGMELSKGFKSVWVYKSWRRGSGQFAWEKHTPWIGSKTKYIYLMQRDIVELVKTDIYVQFEDDTLPPRNAVPRLLKIIESKEDCGIATAIETGRKNTIEPVGLGVHSLVEKKGDFIVKRISCDPNTKGIVEVQACGFYCFATLRHVFARAVADCDKVKSKLPRWGLDTWITNKILEYGYKIYADFSLWCKHMQLAQGSIYYYSKKDARQDCYVWVPELKGYAYYIKK